MDVDEFDRCCCAVEEQIQCRGARFGDFDFIESVSTHAVHRSGALWLDEANFRDDHALQYDGAPRVRGRVAQNVKVLIQLALIIGAVEARLLSDGLTRAENERGLGDDAGAGGLDFDDSTILSAAVILPF